MGDRGETATVVTIANEGREFNRWEIGEKPQRCERAARPLNSLTDGRSGRNRNMQGGVIVMLPSLTDGRSGRNRNMQGGVIVMLPSLTDGRSGRNRNAWEHS